MTLSPNLVPNLARQVSTTANQLPLILKHWFDSNLMGCVAPGSHYGWHATLLPNHVPILARQVCIPADLRPATKPCSKPGAHQANTTAGQLPLILKHWLGSKLVRHSYQHGIVSIITHTMRTIVDMIYRH